MQRNCERYSSALNDVISTTQQFFSLIVTAQSLTFSHFSLLGISAAAREKVGNIDIMPKAVNSATTFDELMSSLRERVDRERTRIEGSLDSAFLEPLVRSEYDLLTRQISEPAESWKKDIPGRIVFNRFASLAQMKPGRLKTLYIRKAMEISCDPFLEVRNIFREFRAAS
jgi:hypothetical protein